MPTLTHFFTKFFVVCALFLYLIPSTGAAEEARFISDRIYLDVYEQAKATDEIAFTILSGSPVGVLTIEGDFSQIKNREGKIGWIVSKYISNEKPAQIAFLQIRKKYDASLVKIRELQSKNRLSKDSAKTLKTLKKARSNVASLTKEKKELEKSLSEKTDSLNKSIAAINVLTEQLSEFSDPISGTEPTTGINIPPTQKEFTLPLLWTIAALVLSLVIGVALGIKWLERKISKRHGGVNIY